MKLPDSEQASVDTPSSSILEEYLKLFAQAASAPDRSLVPAVDPSLPARPVVSGSGPTIKGEVMSLLLESYCTSQDALPAAKLLYAACYPDERIVKRRPLRYPAARNIRMTDADNRLFGFLLESGQAPAGLYFRHLLDAYAESELASSEFKALYAELREQDKSQG